MIEAVGNKVLVKVLEKEKKESGFQTVDLKKDTLLKGEVVSIGESVPLDYDFKVGDIIYFSVYGTEECEGFMVLTDDQIYARSSTGETQE